jgi:hypothetical protein
LFSIRKFLMRCPQDGTAASTSSANRCCELDAALQRQGRADRSPRPGGRGNSGARPAAGRFGGLRQPRLRAGRQGARRRRGRDAGADAGIAFHDFKDQAIFDRGDVLTQAGKPFSVFTPYKNAWLKRLTAADYAAHACDGHLAAARLPAVPRTRRARLRINRPRATRYPPGMSGARRPVGRIPRGRIERYGALRDFPAVKGVSYLSVHLRFGTISLRELVRAPCRGRRCLAQRTDLA